MTDDRTPGISLETRADLAAVSLDLLIQTGDVATADLARFGFSEVAVARHGEAAIAEARRVRLDREIEDEEAARCAIS